MNDRTKSILGYVGVGIATALIAGALVWAVMNGRAADEELRATTAEAQVTELESQVASLGAQVDAMASATSDENAEDGDSAAQADGSSEVAADESSEGDTDSDEDGRHFCFVREVVNETGTTMITVDYADMLTGDEAAAAAAAAGQESPPPNDFFISNVNPLLRTFPVQTGIEVTLITQSDGLDMDGYSVTLGQWQDFFIGMTGDLEVLQDVPYWIEIDDGVVTSIEEQYLP